MNSKKLTIYTIIGVFGLIAAIYTLSCVKKVPAGYFGIKVYLLGQKKGVDSIELGPGRYFVGMNQELFLFPGFTQNYVLTKSPTEQSPADESISFQTRESVDVNTDVGISYSFERGKVSMLFQKYRKGVDEITTVVLRNYLRDAFIRVASTMTIEQVNGPGKAILLDRVNKDVSEMVKPVGINIERIFLVGKMRLPQEVVNAINAKIKAMQQAEQRENELRESEAEAKKKEALAAGNANSILIEAEAQAKANRKLAESLTPELVQYKTIEKWDGALSQVSGGSTPFINLSPNK